MAGFDSLIATDNNVSETGNSPDFIRPDLSYYFDIYDKIRDVISGSKAVKNASIKYLPMPNAVDQSAENLARYAGYKTRAIFYGVTRRTLSGLLGQVFNVDPTVKVPTVLDPVIKDANGSGIPLVQLAQETESDVICYGRSGLFIDYPVKDGPTTRAEQLSGVIRPNIIAYKPWNVINWRTEKRGPDTVFTLVVLREKEEAALGAFGIEIKDKYRVLTLENGKYVQTIYTGTRGSLTNDGSVTPLGANGKPLSFIPFTFVGSVNNDAGIDHPPLDDMAELNIGHYRNSADYEDSVYMVGQPTPVITGLTKAWVDEVLKGRVELGSRGAVMLPVGAQFTLEQAQPNTLCKEAMEAKERQMTALGAKLVEQKTVQRTATEASQEQASETSVLATITNNTSAAYKWALEVASIFSGGVTIAEDAKEDTIQFKLNTDFALANMTTEEINSVINAWIKEAISFTEMRTKLRSSGLAVQPDKKAKAEIDKEKQADAEFNNEFNNANNNEA